MHIAKDTLQLLRLFSVIIEHNGAVLKLAPAKKCRYGIKTIRIIFLPGEIRTSNLTFDPGTDGLKVISEQPPKAVQTGCSQGQDRSKVTHPSSSHARHQQAVGLPWERQRQTRSALTQEIASLGDGPHISPIVYWTQRRRPLCYIFNETF
ncbi:hypothetical protein J6590_098740 [Homalodisca vitripennis]|nr:hypothetical protein J6590_098740 [Homalodisca vitripennis]